MKRSIQLIFLLLVSCSTNEQRAQSTAVSVTTFATVDPSVKKQVAGFLADYFALNQTLIDDDFPGAKLAAISFIKTANGFDISKLNPEQLDFYLVHSATLKKWQETIKVQTGLVKMLKMIE